MIEIRIGRRDKRCKMSISEYYDHWEMGRIGTVKENTIGTQRFQFKTISDMPAGKSGRFGDILLKDLRAEDVRSLQAQLAEGHSATSVNQYMNLLSTVLRCAVKERFLEEDPSEGVRRLRLCGQKAVHTIHRALTVQETAAFISAAKRSWYYELYCFMLNTGCRLGEAGAFSFGDIHGNVLMVRRTLTRTVGGVNTVGDDTKTLSGLRKLPLRPEAMEAIRSQMCKKQYELLKLENHSGASPAVMGKSPEFRVEQAFRDCGRVFCAPKGGLLLASNVDGDIRRLCRIAGITPFTSHAFRDTFATRAIESGMNPKTLQDILGHADIRLTMNLYCHCMDDTKQREMIRVTI